MRDQNPDSKKSEIKHMDLKNEIVSMVELLDERRLKLVYTHVQAILGRRAE